MPGTAFWLVVGLTFFWARHATGIYLGFHPEARTNTAWIAARYAQAGFGAGITIGWLAMLLRRYGPMANGTSAAMGLT